MNDHRPGLTGSAAWPRPRETAAPDGRRETLAEAYRAHRAAVFCYVYRRVGDRETAEDLTAEVFIKAVQGLQAGRSAQAVRAWLYAAARTTIADHWRDHAGERIDLACLEHTLGAPVAEERRDMTAQRRVAGLLAALPERDRRVLSLRFLHGYSPAETARLLRVTTGHVKVLQHRALKRAAVLGADPDERGHAQT